MAVQNPPEPDEEPLEPSRHFELVAASLAERDPSLAPARNRPEVAEQIITTARYHGVPLRNDAGLVSVLSGADIDDKVPKELHSAIADVLHWIVRVDNAARSGQK